LERSGGVTPSCSCRSGEAASLRVGITDTEDTTRALAIWAEAKQLGDIALKYCISRGISELSLPNIDGVLRFHPHCPFGRSERHPCIVALWTDAITNQAQAIHRTALTPDGKKLGRMSLGPTAGCVLRLWPDELVTLGLVIGDPAQVAIPCQHEPGVAHYTSLRPRLRSLFISHRGAGGSSILGVH
jgi:hypothetical protein